MIFSDSPREDVLRRDFTVNGLLLDALRFDAGEPLESCVLDFVEGRRDLAGNTIRAIGDPVRRFTEDKLRMLRAVRFAARRGFDLEPATLAAIRQLAPRVVQVSCERIRPLPRPTPTGRVTASASTAKRRSALPWRVPCSTGCVFPTKIARRFFR